MPQQFLDPALTKSAKPAALVSTTLPEHVRKFGYLPDFSLWQPGDLLLFSAKRFNRAQRAIVDTQKRLGYALDDARWHHAAVYIGDRYMCEAIPGGVRYHPVEDVVGQGLIRVRRDPKGSQAQGYQVAIKALIRLPKSYAFRSALRSWLRSHGTEFARAFSHEFRIERDAVICSQLFHDAFMEATSRTLIQRADRDVMPAELSACTGLADVASAWLRLP